MRRIHCNLLLTCTWITIWLFISIITIGLLHSTLLLSTILREGSFITIALRFVGEVLTDSM